MKTFSFAAVLAVRVLPIFAQSDYEALSAFYKSAGQGETGLSWTAGWMDSTAPCDWGSDYISCNSDDEVTWMELNGESVGVDGSIPTELAYLSSMTDLLFNAGTEKLVGTVPTQLGMMTLMKKEFSFLGQGFSGTIPTEFGQLTALTHKLRFFANNHVTGPLPTELGMLTLAKQKVYLQENGLTGTIPTEFGRFTLFTKDLNLATNLLTGSIPSQLALLGVETLAANEDAYLELNLDSNLLCGDVPAVILSITQSDDASVTLFTDGNSIGTNCFAPTAVPSATSEPSSLPTADPSSPPSNEPSSPFTADPSSLPQINPTSLPSNEPSSLPTADPSSLPSSKPTSLPSNEPSSLPTADPSSLPQSNPTSLPSSVPTTTPTAVPSTAPTSLPTSVPTTTPTAVPSTAPISLPTSVPTTTPTAVPSTAPTSLPTSVPTTPVPTMDSTSPPTTAAPTTPGPTSPPTRAPTTGPTVSPVPSVSPSHSDEYCEDDSEWHVVGKKNKDCDWVAKYSAGRCNRPGTSPTGDKVADRGCKATCMSECVPTSLPTTFSPTMDSVVYKDNSSWYIKNKPWLNCSNFVAESPWGGGRMSRCRRTGGDGTRAFTSCCATCGTCENQPTPSPTRLSCSDSSDWRLASKPQKGCSWVSKYPLSRCGRKGVDDNKASKSCPVACDTC